MGVAAGRRTVERKRRGSVSVDGDPTARGEDAQPQFTPRLGFNHLAEEYDGDEVSQPHTLVNQCVTFVRCVVSSYRDSVQNLKVSDLLLKSMIRTLL